MNVNELLDTIEDALEESAGMPLSGGKRIVDVEQIRDYLDEIRQNLPVELRQAQSIVSDRAQLIDSANAQAQAIVKKAEDRARILVSEAEIVKAAQQRASEIVSAAQTEARTVRQTVTDYCDNMLKTTEETMAENAAQVRNVRANLRQTPRKPQRAEFVGKTHLPLQAKVTACRGYFCDFLRENPARKALHSQGGFVTIKLYQRDALGQCVPAGRKTRRKTEKTA